MRITNGMMIDSFLINMQGNLTKMDKYTQQLASNRKIVKLSDDPVGTLNALTAREQLARINQYQRNLGNAKNWVDQCDSSLQELSAKITDVRDQVVYAATNVKTDDDRKNIAALCKELKKSIMETMNTTVGKEYLFAGYNTTMQPLQYAADTHADYPGELLYNGLSMTDLAGVNLDRIQAEAGQVIEMEVGFDLNMRVTFNALEICGVGEENIFKQLDEIVTLMEDDAISSSEAVEKLSGKLGNLDAIHSRVTTCMAQVGAMQTRVEMLENRYSEDIVNYNEIRSKIEDIDSAEVIMDWKMAEAVYKQSLSTGARVIMPTLMDFLN